MSVHFKYHHQVPNAELLVAKIYFSMKNWMQTETKVDAALAHVVIP